MEVGFIFVSVRPFHCLRVRLLSEELRDKYFDRYTRLVAVGIIGGDVLAALGRVGAPYLWVVFTF
jgi:hypothetical protein